MGGRNGCLWCPPMGVLNPVTVRGESTVDRGVRTWIGEPRGAGRLCGVRIRSCSSNSGGGALYLLIAAPILPASCAPQRPAGPPPAQDRVPEARGGSRAKAPRRRLTRCGRGRQHGRPQLLHGIQGNPGIARRVTDSASGPKK
ncbi:hypothetical protein NDU88_004124 [Pleurodeles waltl]|uniref:Uncharacterized protein n=1 Tax=Pleurodeles waltl TaxID=8319 RepID=A0AAV7UES8_PLEWA|nr:hypothetical protein NDU88_004124 [Pleurodeles waltl]